MRTNSIFRRLIVRHHYHSIQGYPCQELHGEPSLSLSITRPSVAKLTLRLLLNRHKSNERNSCRNKMARSTPNTSSLFLLLYTVVSTLRFCVSSSCHYYFFVTFSLSLPSLTLPRYSSHRALHFSTSPSLPRQVTPTLLL